MTLHTSLVGTPHPPLAAHGPRVLSFLDFCWGSIGIMENKMETTIMGYVGIIGYMLQALLGGPWTRCNTHWLAVFFIRD